MFSKIQKKNLIDFLKNVFKIQKTTFSKKIFDFLFIFIFLLTGLLPCQSTAQDPLLASPQWIFPNLEQRYVIFRSLYPLGKNENAVIKVFCKYFEITKGQ